MSSLMFQFDTSLRRHWGLRSNGTESTVKAETLQQQAFQKALFSLNETYHLNSGLSGTEIWNEIAGVSGSCFSAGSTGTPLNGTFCSDDTQTPWMLAIEQSRYFHYGTDKRPVELSPDQPDESEPSWNQQQEAEARARIQQAVTDLLEKEALPPGITERFDALIPYGLSGATLYRHRDLWHPRYLQNATIGALQSDVERDCSWTASRSNNHTNLLGENGCKTLPAESSSPLECLEPGAIGCNSLPLGDLSQTETRNMTQEEGIAYIKQILNQVKARRQVEIAQKRQRLAGQDQLTLPFDQETP